MDDRAAGYYRPPTAAGGYYRSPTTSGHHSYYPPPSVHASPPPHGAPSHPYSRTPLPPLHQSQHSPPYALYQPPIYGATYVESADQPSFDDVRTLFIAGLPGDVKIREIYNLFREFAGYESAKLRSSEKSSQAYAFAVFTDQQSALAAMHSLNGLVFDLERESTLHIDLAKSNSKSKRPRTDESTYSSDRRVRVSAAYSRDFRDSGSGSNTHMPGMVYSPYSLNGYPSTQRNQKLAYDSEHTKLNNSSAHATEINPPCPTLFVSNLGPSCTEKELTQVFSRCPGFLKLKMQNKKSVPVAFVDFEDVQSSTAGLNHLQGSIMHSSDMPKVAWVSENEKRGVTSNSNLVTNFKIFLVLDHSALDSHTRHVFSVYKAPIVQFIW
ncbi:RNA binding protein fox-1 homolog 3-like isoform X2 [Zingiber officinale]|uniref:RNA binding protein fox-1 homolog 3-like isoform X2 n=1 Tax=Zingiber officinale TaxID=94328 RepID=UPI001C4BB819|nr:RNA binding protein fox-1 homolog 3-like isoform X2 [Zingiber officinale]